MAFKVPASKKNQKQNRFEFTVDGKTYSVVKLGLLPGAAALLFDQGRELEGSLACFDDDDAREAYLNLDAEQRDAINVEWVKASRVSPGESEGSTDS